MLDGFSSSFAWEVLYRTSAAFMPPTNCRLHQRAPVAHSIKIRRVALGLVMYIDYPDANTWCFFCQQEQQRLAEQQFNRMHSARQQTEEFTQEVCQRWWEIFADLV